MNVTVRMMLTSLPNLSFTQVQFWLVLMQRFTLRWQFFTPPSKKSEVDDYIYPWTMPQLNNNKILLGIKLLCSILGLGPGLDSTVMSRFPRLWLITDERYFRRPAGFREHALFFFGEKTTNVSVCYFIWSGLERPPSLG